MRWKKEMRKQDEIREYEKQYLSRYKQPKIKKNVSSDLYKPEIPKPKRNMKKERKEYEQKYLSRYKQPKSGVKKSTSWTQHDVALGRLTLSPHFNAKRRAKQLVWLSVKHGFRATETHVRVTTILRRTPLAIPCDRINGRRGSKDENRTQGSNR